eukprot:4316986-Prymnesium_polylepis.1
MAGRGIRARGARAQAWRRYQPVSTEKRKQAESWKQSSSAARRPVAREATREHHGRHRNAGDEWHDRGTRAHTAPDTRCVAQLQGCTRQVRHTMHLQSTSRRVHVGTVLGTGRLAPRQVARDGGPRVLA